MADKSKRIAFLGFFLLVLLRVLATRIDTQPNNSVNNHSADNLGIQNGYVISNKQIKQKGSMCDFDATTDYVYFAYSEKNSIVDVFDSQGNFLYSILFENQEKGGLLIRCEDEMLYVRLKNDDVMVFNGDRLTQSFGKEESEKAGMDYHWFNEKPVSIRLKGIRFYRMDALGHTQHQIAVPGYVVVSYYNQYFSFAFVLIVSFIVLLSKIMRREIHSKTDVRDVSRNGTIR